jgi:hypothetical protein
MITQKKHVIEFKDILSGYSYSKYYEYKGVIEFPPFREKRIGKFTVKNNIGDETERYYLNFKLRQYGGEVINLFCYDVSEKQLIYDFQHINNGDKIKVFLTKKEKDKSQYYTQDNGEFEIYRGTTLHYGHFIFKESFKNNLLYYMQINDIFNFIIFILIGPSVLLFQFFSWWSFGYSLLIIIILYLLKNIDIK